MEGEIDRNWKRKMRKRKRWRRCDEGSNKGVGRDRGGRRLAEGGLQDI